MENNVAHSPENHPTIYHHRVRDRKFRKEEIRRTFSREEHLLISTP